MRNRAPVYAAEVKEGLMERFELKCGGRASSILAEASSYAKPNNRNRPPSMTMPEKIPFGVIAPMTTPFSETGDLLPGAIRSQVEFLVRERADSLAVGGSTGEGQTLSPDELRACVSETRAAMPADMPLIASAIVDSTRQAVRSIRAVEGLGVDAIQITPVHYLFRPDDEMMIEHFRVIHEETGMPLIIYNVVHWCYLSPELTVRLMNEVPGVMGIKQSAGDLKLFADLMIDAPKDRKIYSAVDALMYPSFCLGTPGVIAATPSGIPRATALLRDAVAKADHANALRLHEAILRFWNATDHFNLPACIRYAQSLQGVEAGCPRMPMRPATEAQRAKIKPALEAVLDLADELS
jgi:4-hydroxy-tetrahydrodipicolinate synthase